jgi:hypothetical protein
MPSTTATVLKDKLKTKIQSIVGVAEVLDYPSQDFNQFPAVQISFDGNVSNYETNKENDELFTFSVYVFQIIEGVFTKVKSRLIIEELSDTIRDNLDSDEFLSGIVMPTNKTILGVRPTTSEIGEDDEGKYVIAKIEVAIRISKFN